MMKKTIQCFHCGDRLRGAPIVAVLNGEERPVCCNGCKVVAEFIDGSGLAAYYQHRRKPEPDTERRPERQMWQEYDSSDLLQRYVCQDLNHAETTLDIGGMHCSACVWLLENALKQNDALRSITVNPATRRAVIRWDLSALKFSELLEHISRIGFQPAPVVVGRAEDLQGVEYRRSLKRLIVSAVAGMQVMMFAAALYAGDYFGIDANVERFLRILSLLLAMPIVLYSARPFFEGAWRGMRARAPGMDLPVALAIAAAFVASARAVWLNHGEIYFDSIAMFVLFLGLTRFLEMRSRHRSGDHVQALSQLLPDTATRLIDEEPETVALDRLRLGDAVAIRPGDVVPVDGEILSGKLAVDESMLTGEALPADRVSGMKVWAGSINRAGNATVRVTSVGASTSLAEIGRLLEKAQADRPPIARLADYVASKFVVGVLAITAVTGTVWWYLDPARAFEIVLATLVVTCPCALALATPAALAAAASRLARNGFLLVRSRVLEVLNRGAIIVFDKTGTLTEGRPTVLATELLPRGRERSADFYLKLAAAIETESEHVLARAFSPHYSPKAFLIESVHVEPGGGIEASVDQRLYRIGSANFVCELSGSVVPPDAPGEERTHVFIGSREGLLARFVIGDALRADAAAAIRELDQLGFKLAIASGDSEPAVAAVAKRLGIENRRARLSPSDKLAFIRGLQEAGEQVVMVGDGINDAPVLGAADASIALDAGTALARASADAVVLGQRLGSVCDAAMVARKTHRVIWQNIAWAIVYNLTAIPLAVSGTLTPWMAAIGMSASSLLVVLNALRLHGVEKADVLAERERETALLHTEAAT